jgi:hypothetical protein
MIRRFVLALAVLILILARAGQVRAETITFSEISSQPVDGLTFRGVTYAFTGSDGLPSQDAFFNATGPGQLNFVQDPVLSGTASGTLKLTFATPTSKLSFGAALNIFDKVESAVRVQLFDKSLRSIGTFDVDTDPVAVFSESQFKYSGTPVSQAVLKFSDPVPPTRFAIDNLTYNFRSDVINEVPEPTSLTLFFTGTVALLFRARCRRPPANTA